MFIIFNLTGVAFCVLALFGGWGVKFSAWALGFDESAHDLGFGVAWCAAVVLLDVACLDRSPQFVSQKMAAIYCAFHRRPDFLYSNLDLSHCFTDLPACEDVHMSAPVTNYSDILAALRDVERSGGSFMERSITRGFFVGPPICLVACVILGNLLVLAGPHRAEAFSESLNVWTGVYGFFLGIFVGPLVDAIRKEKKATEQVLEKAIARLNVSANDVGRVIHDHELKLPKSAGAFARLKKRKVL